MDIPMLQKDIKLSDNRHLTYYKTGTGKQLVVLEAGLGMSGHYWGPTIAHLIDHCQVIAYDRAGIGKSTQTLQYVICISWRRISLNLLNSNTTSLLCLSGTVMVRPLFVWRAIS